MKRHFLHIFSIFAIFLTVGCGTEPRNTIVLQVAGSDLEYNLQNTLCEAALPFAGGNSPVRCYGRFRTTDSISDGITFDIFDAFFVEANLNQNIPFSPSTVFPVVTLDGIDRGVIDGFANFSEISNFSGGRVCFQFVAILTDATIQGNFCDNIAVGGAF